MVSPPSDEQKRLQMALVTSRGGHDPIEDVISAVMEMILLEQKQRRPSLPAKPVEPDPRKRRQIKSPSATKEKDMSKTSEENEPDVQIMKQGDKVIVPEGVDLVQVIESLHRRMAEEEEEVSLSTSFELNIPEGLMSLLAVLREKYGFVNAQATPFMFGKQPPTYLGLETGVRQTEQVPWGRLGIPQITGYLEPSFTMKDDTPRFVLKGRVKGKDKWRIDQLVSFIKNKPPVLYKGKAIRLSFPEDPEDASIEDFFPTFMELTNVDENDLIFSREIEDLISDSLFTPIEHTETCRRDGIPLKRGVLLEGPYGVGKTLTAAVTANKCIKHGWTFIYLNSVEDLPSAVDFARHYQPAVIFAEDLDEVLNGEERDDMINGILNSTDGIDTKGLELITVLTTNNVQDITQAMLRPGRLDTVVPVRPPNEEAVIRLIRRFCGQHLAATEDLTNVSRILSGRIPAVIKEVIEKSKLGAIRRGSIEEGTLRITAADISTAAMGMMAHMNLLNPKQEDRRSNEEKAAAVHADAIVALASALGGKERSNGVKHGVTQVPKTSPEVQ